MIETNRLTALIVGGYGTFGGRLVRLLADEPRLTLIVAGRSMDKASRFCATLQAAARLRPAAFDRDGDLPGQIAALKPDLVVDASGPFQLLGPKPYRVVEACLALGIAYADLADGSAFVGGIDRFDAAARAAGIFVLSGLSTFPALTFAALRDLSGGIDQVERISAGVAPSPHAEVGLSVMRAIASYAGRAVALQRAGARRQGFGLVETRRMTIAPPGCLPLGSRVFSLVDVPDLTLAGQTFPGLDAIWVGAGTQPALLHRGLVILAWLVRLRLLPSLAPLAGLFHRAKAELRWGEDRGGLIVEVEGRDTARRRVSRSWHLVAEGGDGPFIPCFPAEALIRAVLDGKRPPLGASSAAGFLRLSEFEPLFAKHRIVTGLREDNAATRALPLYQRMLGQSWAALPASVQALHATEGSRRFSGFARVERGTGVLADLLARVVGFPAAGADIPVSVRFETQDGVEIWHRDFAGRRFGSRQSEGRGPWRHLVVERFGPVAVGLALVVADGRLRLVVRHWSVFGLPLPVRLAPGGDTFESEEDGRFAFHVEIATPFTGLVVRYRGWLLPIR